MSILVQKFGGTSVESYEKMNEVCKIVKAYKKNDEELQLVLVVSAMGRKGAPYPPVPITRPMNGKWSIYPTSPTPPPIRTGKPGWFVLIIFARQGSVRQ